MKRVVIIAISLLSVLVAAQAQNAQYKLLRQEWTANDDGSITYHYRHELTIHRNRALTAYADKGETFVVFNPDYEELTVNECYTLRADGSRVDMRESAYVMQLPASCTDCARFNHLRELAMVHTGMEIGCTIVVDYSIRRQYSTLNETLTLAKDCPIDRYEVNITLPKSQELRVQLTLPDMVAAPTVSEERTENSLRLVATNLPQTSREPYLPDAYHLYPTLHFYNGTHEYTPAFAREVLPAAASEAWRMAGDKEPLDVVRTLCEYINREIHLNDIAPIHTAYTHATASEVWESGCGTAVDKAVLLAAILNTLGYNATVTDDNPEKVAVMIDTVPYMAHPRTGQTATTPYGSARDAADKVQTSRKASLSEFRPDTLADGYIQLHIPALATNTYGRLAATRVLPIATTPCSYSEELTVELPKGATAIIDKQAMNQTIKQKGLGQSSIVVKQKGTTLSIKRSLTLEVESVEAARIGDLRSLTAPLIQCNQLLILTK